MVYCESLNKTLFIWITKFFYGFVNQWYILMSNLLTQYLTVCCLFKLRDIDEIKKIQKRATKIIIKLKHKPYKERLIHLNLQWSNGRALGYGAEGWWFESQSGPLTGKLSLFTQQLNGYLDLLQGR